jgi:hypothetical protein
MHTFLTHVSHAVAEPHSVEAATGAEIQKRTKGQNQHTSTNQHARST